MSFPAGEPAVLAGGGAFAGGDPFAGGGGGRAGAGPFCAEAPTLEGALGAGLPGPGAAAGAMSYIAATSCDGAIGGGAIEAGAGIDGCMGAPMDARGIIDGASAGMAAAPQPVTSWSAARCASAAAKRRMAGDRG